VGRLIEVTQPDVTGHGDREEIRRLRVENQALNEQVARHLGAARAASVTKRF
jgi:hypothetical protein